jgi:hypothetical protein
LTGDGVHQRELRHGVRRSVQDLFQGGGKQLPVECLAGVDVRIIHVGHQELSPADVDRLQEMRLRAFEAAAGHRRPGSVQDPHEEVRASVMVGFVQGQRPAHQRFHARQLRQGGDGRAAGGDPTPPARGRPENIRQVRCRHLGDLALKLLEGR